jgi:peptide/nickel transport system substrate-binding protein
LGLKVLETSGLIGVLRFNFLHPPFDNPKIRQAVLKAVNQRDYMVAVAGENGAVLDTQVGIFSPGMPMATDAGMEVLSGKHDPAALKKEIMDAGYKGERVVLLTATDVPRINAICEVGAAMLRGIGLNVDDVSTDWGTVVQRINKPDPVDNGGWSIFGSFWGGWDFMNPAGHLALRGIGMGGWNGWPTMPEIETLRSAWLTAPDLASEKEIATKIQLQAWQDVPFLPLGSYQQPSAYRKGLVDIMPGLPMFTSVKRG